MASPLLSARDLSYTVNGEYLFENLSLVIHERERCALIGANGSGKSTLLKVLNGDLHADSGEVIKSRSAQSSYVPQTDHFTGKTIEHELTIAISSLSVSERDRSAAVAKALALGGFADRNLPIAHLSGGWKKRLAIVRGLLGNPNLLLLDEPTNHLDIEGISWLEDLLNASNVAIIFISHDRYLIENAAHRVFELKNIYPGGLLSVSGPYSTFLETRQNFLEQQESYRQSLSNRVRTEIEWLRRGAKARTTKQKGRIKWAGEMISELSNLKQAPPKQQMAFQSSNRGTQDLVTVEEVDFSYSGLPICRNFSHTFKKGSRVGIVGSNGSGKTTLLNLLLGKIQPDKGTIKSAVKLKVATLDQMRTAIDPSKNLKEALSPGGDAVVFNGVQQHVVGWARRFGFTVNQLSTPVGSLSGGEKAKVLIASLMSQPADILVLDEPTNDLDIETIEILEESLLEYKGVVIIVSHDRSLLDRVSTEIIGMVPGKGAVLFADHLQWADAVEEIGDNVRGRGDGSAKKANSAASLGASGQPDDISWIEARITELEAQIVEQGLSVADPSIEGDSEELTRRCDALQESQEELDRVVQRWEAALENQETQ